MTKKITERKWYGHVERRDEEHLLRRMIDAPVTRKDTERKTENQRKTYGKYGVKGGRIGKYGVKGGGRIGKYGVKGGGRIGQDKVEE